MPSVAAALDGGGVGEMVAVGAEGLLMVLVVMVALQPKLLLHAVTQS